MAKNTAHKAHRACTPVITSQEAKDTAHTKEHTESRHRSGVAKWPRTPQMQHNTWNVHTNEQEPSGQGHRTHHTTHWACTLVNMSQVAKDMVHATQHTEGARR